MKTRLQGGKCLCKRRHGSSIAEFAPAFYLLMFFAFFPMLDLLGMLLAYADCQYLHFTLVRQAALENILSLNTSSNPPSLTVSTNFATDPTTTFYQLINSWYNGIGHFAVGSMNNVNVQANVNLQEGTPTLKYVHVTTTVTCNPLVPVPFPIAVPGLNQPLSFSLSGSSVIENVPS